MENIHVPEKICVLRTYSMPNLYMSLPFRVHQLLVYLLSFLTVPSKLSAEIDLKAILEMTKLTLQTIREYMSIIGQIKGRTSAGLCIPLIKGYRINTEKQLLELELNGQYVSAFSIQFSHSLVIPETMLLIKKRNDYSAALRLAILIANKCHSRRGFAWDIKVPVGDFLDGFTDSMRTRWRCSFLQMINTRFNLFKHIKFFSDWYIIDAYGDPDVNIYLNSLYENAETPVAVIRLTRSWTRFLSASIVFELTDYWQ